MSDGDKLRALADWLDRLQDSDRFPEWSDSREVQEDLRRIANKLDLAYVLALQKRLGNLS